MPNRIIKDSIRTSKKVNTMTDFQFRFWVYLVTYVDDYGRGSADPELLKGFVFPRRKGLSEATIQKTLTDLATIGCIRLYEVEGESYFCFPNWSDHQTIRNQKSKFPKPLKENEISCKQLQTTASNCSRNPIQSESELESESNPKSAVFSNPELQRALEGFIDMRRAIKKPLTDRALEMILTRLDKLSSGVTDKDRYKAEALNQSVLNNWAGVFEVRDFTDSRKIDSDPDGMEEAYQVYLEEHSGVPFSERLTMSEFYEKWTDSHD